MTFIFKSAKLCLSLCAVLVKVELSVPVKTKPYLQSTFKHRRMPDTLHCICLQIINSIDYFLLVDWKPSVSSLSRWSVSAGFSFLMKELF